MNLVERILEEIKNRGIPVSRLEKACGFGNGYIKSLKKGMMPAHRLRIVAQYLNVSETYLLTGEKLASEELAENGEEEPMLGILTTAQNITTDVVRDIENNPDLVYLIKMFKHIDKVMVDILKAYYDGYMTAMNKFSN